MKTEVEKIIKREILERMLASDDVYSKLKERKEDVFKLIPELEAEDGFDQKNPWHSYDVWEHTLVALSKSKRDLQIRLALLLHDIGKPYCYTEDENKIRHFAGHAEESAKMAIDILERFGYNMQENYDISYLILKHSSNININNINEKNLEMVKKLLHIQYCDAYAYNPEYTKQVTDKLDKVKEKIEEIEKSIKEKEEYER